MQKPLNSPSERMMRRPPSRSPSPSPTPTAAASAELETSPRPSRDDQPLFHGRNGSQDSQVVYSHEMHERPRQYERVATEGASTPHVQPPKRKIKFTTILTDITVILLPVTVITFITYIWSLKDSQINQESYTSWDNAIKVMATILPILFALVVGRLLAEITRWRLERGASVGSLEQLMGSRTVGGTITTLFQFQAWNLLTLALLAIWALSPLGTQSLLQLSSLQPGQELNETETAYFDNSARSQLVRLSAFQVGKDEQEALDIDLRIVARLYTTLVSMPESSKMSTMDLWGNVKIPYLDPAGGNNWKEVPEDLGMDGYSSLVGVPLAHTTPDSNTSFLLESSYIQLQCNKITHQVQDIEQEMLQVASLDFASQMHVGSLASTYKLPNDTWHGTPQYHPSSINATTWSLGLNRFVNPLWFGGNKTNNTDFQERAQNPRTADLHRPYLFTDEEGIEAGPTELIFQAACRQYTFADYPPDFYLAGYCGITQKYVESRVNCTRANTGQQSCKVTAQRPLQKRHAPEAITPLSFPTIFHFVSREMPRTTGGPISYRSEPSLYYLADPGLKTMVTKGPTAFLENVTTTDLQIRLGQLLNTYYQLTQLSLDIVGAAAGDPTLDPNITTAAESSRSVLRFGVSNIWAGLCLASCATMLAAGVLSAAVAHRARSPEILGYVSTAFRDSRHMRLAADADQLSAVELSKSMADQRIRYGVLRGEDGEEIGMGIGREDARGSAEKRIA